MQDINLILTLKNGDFVLADDEQTLKQSENIILSSNKGMIMPNLLLGVGIFKYLHGPAAIKQLNRSIRTEFEKDGIRVQKFNIINGQIYLETRQI